MQTLKSIKPLGKTLDVHSHPVFGVIQSIMARDGGVWLLAKDVRGMFGFRTLQDMFPGGVDFLRLRRAYGVGLQGNTMFLALDALPDVAALSNFSDAAQRLAWIQSCIAGDDATESPDAACDTPAALQSLAEGITRADPVLIDLLVALLLALKDAGKPGKRGEKASESQEKLAMNASRRVKLLRRMAHTMQ